MLLFFIGSVTRATDQTVPVAVPDATDLAIRYHETGIGVWLLSILWGIAVPAVLLFSGWSAKLRDRTAKLVGGRFLVPTYVALYLALVYLADLPLNAAVGHFRQRAYGLSTETFAAWWLKSLIGLAVGMVVAVPLAWGGFWILRRAPKRWWLYVGLLALPLGLFASMVKPIWVDPLFSHFGAMKNKGLEAKIDALAARAGIEGSRIFEVDKSKETKTVNAYVTGFAATKRIVLWDTLLEKLDEEEVLHVMAHEMGHYVRNHVILGISLATLGSVAILFLVDRAGRRLIVLQGGRFGFVSLADVAAVPLLILLLQIFNLVGSPVGLAVSRAIEHDADRFALDLTHANHSAGTAFRKLLVENLSVPRPHPLLKYFRSTHPPIGERIDFCNEYHPWRP